MDVNSSSKANVLFLFQKLWKYRLKLIYSVFGSVLLAIIIIIFSEKEYESNISFVPQTSEKTGFDSSIGGLASLAGINLNSNGGSELLPPIVYPKILSSTPFKMSLLESKIFFTENSVEISYRNYLSISRNDFFKATKNQITNLIDQLHLERKRSKYTKEGVFITSEKDIELFDIIDSKITIDYNKEVGIVKLSVLDRDPLVSAQLALSAMEILQKFIIDFKIKKAVDNFNFIDEQYFAKKNEVKILQDSIADFKDGNKNIATSKFELRLTRLTDSYALTNSVFVELAKQREKSKLEIKKSTPVFRILEPVKLPTGKLHPKSLMVLFTCTFFIVTLTVLIILLKEEVLRLIKLITKK